MSRCTALLCLALMSPTVARAAEIENEVLRVELDERAPLVKSILHKPTGVRLDAAGELGRSWEIRLTSGSVDLEGCRTRPVFERGAASYEVDTGKGVAFTVEYRLERNEILVTIDEIREQGARLGGIVFKEPFFAARRGTGDWKIARTDIYNGGYIDDAFEGGSLTTDYAVLYSDRLAVALHTNLVRDPVRIARSGKAAGIAPGYFHYALKEGAVGPFEGRIALLSDENGDGAVDWQDGCVWLHRQVPGELPEIVGRDLLGWVGIETAQGNGMNATFPQVLDEIRRIYHVTAGESVAVGLAGWCYWGWDSEYPAVEEPSRRAGGTRGLVELCRDAWRYGGRIALCVNFDDAYPHSPAWTKDIMCLNRDGTPKVYMEWAGGLAYHICPYKDWTTGDAKRRMDTMLDFGTSGSVYIDVLSAALDKTSDEPGGCGKMDNLVTGKFNIAKYYKDNGVDIYSEHVKYPFVGRILGGLNCQDVGLHEEPNRIPMPAFILHGKMNNFFNGAMVGGWRGKMLIGVVPTVSGRVWAPSDEDLDTIFLQCLVARRYAYEPASRFSREGRRFRMDYGPGTRVELDLSKNAHRVVVGGRLISDGDSMFVRRGPRTFWAYASRYHRARYPRPEGWERLRTFVLNREGAHQEAEGLARLAGDEIEITFLPRVPMLVTDGEDFPPLSACGHAQAGVRDERAGRRLRVSGPAGEVRSPLPPPESGFERALLTPRGVYTWGKQGLRRDGEIVLAEEVLDAAWSEGTGAAALVKNSFWIESSGRKTPVPSPPAGGPVSIEAAEGRVYVGVRTSRDPGPYRDKRRRLKDEMLVYRAGSTAPERSVKVLGPVCDMIWDAPRRRIVAGTAAYNFDGVQFVDPAVGRVEGLVPLVPEGWGEDVLLAVGRGRLFAATPQTGRVAELDLSAQFGERAAELCGRIFERPTDRRDPEAALDGFLDMRWDRIIRFYKLGFVIKELAALEGGGFYARGGVRGGPALAARVVPAEGPVIPPEKAGKFPPLEDFPRLERALRLPREEIVACDPPGGPPWWVQTPREKHAIVPEPQPPGAVMFPCVSPHYADVEKAKDHAALIGALRIRGMMRQKAVMPLVRLGERVGAKRNLLRPRYDYWLVPYRYAEKELTPKFLRSLPRNEWYVETIRMPDGRTMYRAGLLLIFPAAEADRVYLKALKGEEEHYRRAAEREKDPARRREYEKFVEVFRRAPEEAKVNWLAE